MKMLRPFISSVVIAHLLMATAFAANIEKRDLGLDEDDIQSIQDSGMVVAGGFAFLTMANEFEIQKKFPALKAEMDKLENKAFQIEKHYSKTLEMNFQDPAYSAKSTKLQGKEMEKFFSRVAEISEGSQRTSILIEHFGGVDGGGPIYAEAISHDARTTIEAIRNGIQSTPSYAVNVRVQSWNIPAEKLVEIESLRQASASYGERIKILRKLETRKTFTKIGVAGAIAGATILYGMYLRNKMHENN